MAFALLEKPKESMRVPLQNGEFFLATQMLLARGMTVEQALAAPEGGHTHPKVSARRTSDADHENGTDSSQKQQKRITKEPLSFLITN